MGKTGKESSNGVPYRIGVAWTQTTERVITGSSWMILLSPIFYPPVWSLRKTKPPGRKSCVGIIRVIGGGIFHLRIIAVFKVILTLE
jgi:hypothetical protein